MDKSKNRNRRKNQYLTKKIKKKQMYIGGNGSSKLIEQLELIYKFIGANDATPDNVYTLKSKYDEYDKILTEIKGSVMSKKDIKKLKSLEEREIGVPPKKFVDRRAEDMEKLKIVELGKKEKDEQILSMRTFFIENGDDFIDYLNKSMGTDESGNEINPSLPVRLHTDPAFTKQEPAPDGRYRAPMHPMSALVTFNGPNGIETDVYIPDKRLVRGQLSWVKRWNMAVQQDIDENFTLKEGWDTK